MATQTVESVILDIFRAVLKAPSMRPGDDFFSCYGDSLLAVEAAIQISEAIGTEIDATMVIMYPSARELTQALADLAPDQDGTGGR